MSVYFHIPFCNKKCTYCDFHFSTRYQSYYKFMIEAICKEFDLKKHRIQNKIESLYFGGGTPGILKTDDLALFIEKTKSLEISDDFEITLEVNPENINIQNLKEWKNLGVNRLSIGIQSFDDNILKWMNRTHSGKDSINAINKVKDFGFENINIDLIFSIPNTDIDYLRKQAEIVKNLPISHISVYQLTIEKNTLLSYQINNKIVNSLSDENSIKQFVFAHDFLENIGFEHYEISNYAKEKMYSKHNLSYWNGNDYLGLGPSAHSFHSPRRYWNIRNNKKYIELINNNILPEENEILNNKNIFNEKVMLGLRTKWGVNLDDLKKVIKLSDDFLNIVNDYQNRELLLIEKNQLKLTKQGLLLADKITSDLFYV